MQKQKRVGFLGILVVVISAVFSLFNRVNGEVKYKVLPSTPSTPVLYGYGFFKQKVSPEELVGPVSLNYLIGPGDEIAIDVWGELTFNYLLKVNNEGYIDIPEAGRVFVNGLTYEQLKSRVIGQMAKVYSSQINPYSPGTSRAIVDVTIGKVKGVRITTSGETQTPGAYLIPASQATVFNALIVSGGIKPSGSLRDIRVVKASGKELSFDSYDFLLKGKIDNNVLQLQAGDVVFVPVKGSEVTISGEVKRPAVYELKKGETLNNLIEIAGGFTPVAYPQTVHLVRMEPGKGKSYIDLNNTENKSRDFELTDGDSVTIPKTPQIKEDNFVEIQGEGIKSPGIYAYKPHMTLNELIDKAGGLYQDALSERADLVRTRGDFTTIFSTFSLQTALSTLFLLQPMDKITTYASYELKGGKKYITVRGRVKKPGVYPLSDNLTIKDILYTVGGFDDMDFRKTVCMDKMDLLKYKPDKPEREVISLNLTNVLSGEENDTLQSNDEIVIYENPEFVPLRKVEIKGEVKFPGMYVLQKREERVSDLVKRAGGVLPSGFWQGAQLTRTYENLGRVNLDLKKAIQKRGSSYDPILFDGDQLVIPEKEYVVKVKGEVWTPGVVQYIGKDFDDYLEACGGVKTETGDRKRIRIIYPNGIVKKVRSFWADPPVYEGCTIEVPKRIEKKKEEIITKKEQPTEEKTKESTK